MWPLSRDLLLNPLHGLLVGEAGDGETVTYYLDDGVRIFVDEVRYVERILLRIYLHWLVPVPFVFLPKRCMPHKDGIGVCHQYAF